MGKFVAQTRKSLRRWSGGGKVNKEVDNNNNHNENGSEPKRTGRRTTFLDDKGMTTISLEGSNESKGQGTVTTKRTPVVPLVPVDDDTRTIGYITYPTDCHPVTPVLPTKETTAEMTREEKVSKVASRSSSLSAYLKSSFTNVMESLSLENDTSWHSGDVDDDGNDDDNYFLNQEDYEEFLANQQQEQEQQRDNPEKNNINNHVGDIDNNNNDDDSSVGTIESTFVNDTCNSSCQYKQYNSSQMCLLPIIATTCLLPNQLYSDTTTPGPNDHGGGGCEPRVEKLQCLVLGHCKSNATASTKSTCSTEEDDSQSTMSSSSSSHSQRSLSVEKEQEHLYDDKKKKNHISQTSYFVTTTTTATF